MTEAQELREGILAYGYGGFYTAVDGSGTEYVLRCKKKLKHQRMTPTVGDRIRFCPGTGEEEGWLEEILPRNSLFIRPPVANVSLMLAVIAPAPEPDMVLVDRLLLRAESQDIRTALVVTKCDLDPDLYRKAAEEYRPSGIPVFPVSAVTGAGLAPLRSLMKGEICCLAGQSGVGKSTLLNALMDLNLETGDISKRIRRGKNTTRKAELLIKDGLMVFDTAGFSLLELESGIDPVNLQEWYPEFRPYLGKCRFEPCYHDREPGCAVLQAASDGNIHPERLNRYRLLLSECRERWKSRYD